MQPFLYLLYRETVRFLSVSGQTVLGPMVVAILFQLIFGGQWAKISTGDGSVPYATFLIPGLVMMQALSNSFANGSSSLIQSKYNGNIIYTLMAPIAPGAIYAAYILGCMVRGVMVGIAVFIAIAWFGAVWPTNWWAIIYFLLLGTATMGGLGIIAGIICDKFDKLSTFESFIVTPLVYLAGVFFNPQHLAGFWGNVARLNPLLYIVDGFRYGFIGHANSQIVLGALVVLGFAMAVNTTGYLLIKYGVGLKQ